MRNLVNIEKNRPEFIKYYLMNDSYDFVEVDKKKYENPPDGFINNRIMWTRDMDGADFYDIECGNVDPQSLRDFFNKVGLF
jgi:hypothetical protein